jgi:hypothetical protein
VSFPYVAYRIGPCGWIAVFEVAVLEEPRRVRRFEDGLLTVSAGPVI